MSKAKTGEAKSGQVSGGEVKDGNREPDAGEPAEKLSRPDDAAAAAAEEEKRLRQNLPAPICPYHKVPCKCGRGDPFFTRYYCPEEGCTYSQKVPRPKIGQIAQRCAAQEEDFSAR